MTRSNTNHASNTDFLHPDKNPKTYTVGRPITMSCDGQTKKLSCFVDKILQPIAQQQL